RDRHGGARVAHFCDVERRRKAARDHCGRPRTGLRHPAPRRADDGPRRWLSIRNRGAPEAFECGAWHDHGRVDTRLESGLRTLRTRSPPEVGLSDRTWADGRNAHGWKYQAAL